MTIGEFLCGLGIHSNKEVLRMTRWISGGYYWRVDGYKCRRCGKRTELPDTSDEMP